MGVGSGALLGIFSQGLRIGLSVAVFPGELQLNVGGAGISLTHGNRRHRR